MNKKINLKIVAIIIILLLLIVAWLVYWQVGGLIVSQDRNRYQNIPAKATAPVTSSSNLNSNQAKQTKKTTLRKTSQGDRYTNYQGSITVSGKYVEYNPETMLGGYLCFFPDEKTGYLIPREPDFWGPGNPDTREPWFCFEDQAGAKKLFGINDQKIFKDSAVECLSGPATVTVSHYVTDRLESETFDRAQLDKVISSQKYSLSCPQ